MAKAAKPNALQETAAPPPRKSKLILITVAAALMAGGGAAAYLLLKPSHEQKTESAAEGAQPAVPIRIFDLVSEAKPLVVNLVHEEGDRYLQVEISLQISSLEVEENIKTNIKLIMDAVNTVLAKKRPSDLSAEGWVKVKDELKVEINHVLGFANEVPAIVTPHESTTAASDAATEGVGEQAVAPASGEKRAVSNKQRGVIKVLIPHYLIQ